MISLAMVCSLSMSLLQLKLCNLCTSFLVDTCDDSPSCVSMSCCGQVVDIKVLQQPSKQKDREILRDRKEEREGSEL